MTSLFISYSRKDTPAARKLAEAFERLGLDFWIDWEGIPPTVDWWKEIEKGIEEADSFLFLLSPDSVQSKVCKQELEHATKNGKRLIPLVVRDVTANEPPPELRHLNWIFVRPEDDFEASFSKLVAAIQTDYKWVKAHRELQVEALEWERSNHENSFLLRGRQLRDAELQLVRNASKEPHPTDLQREFVLKSRQVEDRQRRTVTTIAIMGAILMALLAIYGLAQANLANERARIAHLRELAGQSALLRDQRFQTSLLLGLEVFRQLGNNPQTLGLLLDNVRSHPQLRQYLVGHSRAVNSVAISPDGKLIASAGSNNMILLWDAVTYQRLGAPLMGHTDSINSIAFSPDGKTLASGSDDKTLILWDVETGQPIGPPLTRHTDSVNSVAFNPDGTVLASGAADRTILLWDPELQERIGEPLALHSGSVHRIAFSPDGKTLASGSADATIRLWNLETYQPMGSALEGHSGSVDSLAFSPDGTLLLSGSIDADIIAWDLSTHQQLGEHLTSHDRRVNSIAFRRDGEMFASASDEGTIILWETETRTPIGTPLTGHIGAVNSVVFSPDGKTLISGSADSNVILWSAAESYPITQVLELNLRRINSVVFSPDGKTLAVVGASGSGKSSLVRAGLTIALKQAGWDVRIFTPGSGPLKALEMQLELDMDTPRPERLLILVDQFEETFTLCHEESERVSFIENLLNLAQEPSKKVTVVIALRADFYSHCAQYPSLRQAVAAKQEYIGQMAFEELRRAIEEPAKRGGWEFEPGLVDVLLNDIGAQGTSEPEPGALPLLSHALLATWERRRGRTLTLDGYYVSGGVRGAIAETAESVFTDYLNRTQQEIARDVFLRLTELGEGTEDTRRRATLNELVRQSAEVTQLREVLNTLAEARLITLNEDSAEVAHEALIREWQRLHEWLMQDRESLLLHRHLTESAHEWEVRGHDPAELYRGARLAQAREWASANEERLNAAERGFLAASIEQEEHDALEREVQRQRELEAAQKLAKTQSRAAKQLRWRAMLLAGASVLAMVLAGTAIFFGNQAGQNASEAQSRELAAAAISNLDDDPERSILLALQAVSEAHTLEAENALHRSILASRIMLVVHHDAEIWGVTYSPDGRRIATASQDKTAKIWDATTGQLLLTLSSHTESVNGVAYSPDGKRIATASQDKTTKIWDAVNGQLLFTLSGHAESVHAVTYSPDGTRLVTSSDDGTARVWDLETGEELLRFSGHGDAVYDAAFSPDGKHVATSGLDVNVRIWNALSGEELLTLPVENGDQLRGIAFSPDGTRIAVTSAGFPKGRVWNVATSEVLWSGFPDHRDTLLDIAFSSDGRLLATGSADTKAKVWDSTSGQVLYTLSGHTLPITSVALNYAGTRLATASWDHTVRVWDITPAKESLFIPIDSPWSLRTSYSPDGTQLLTDYPKENTAKIWDATSGKELLTLNGPSAPIFLTAYSPDGKTVAGSSEDTIVIWDAKTGKQQFMLAGHTDSIISMDFSPDGTRLASGSSNGELILWDLVRGNILSTLQGPTVGPSPLVKYAVFAVAYSPDGHHLLSGDTYGQGIIWDITTGKKLVTVLYEEGVGSHTPGATLDAAYSPDGKRVALTGGLGATRIWDAFTGKELLTLKGHTGVVVSVTFSPDGKRIATASIDGTAKVWDAMTGLNLLTLPIESHGAGGVSFRPDGKRLAVGGVSGVYVFVLPIDEVIELAKSRLTRSLTAEECQQYLHVTACPVEP